ncbi:MAG: hypothetical protein VX151_06280 [Candidatus Thermoplasmatota archaeon]|nr:hypothetical protein [Candidatus Thermoplasmatota archaeon]
MLLDILAMEEVFWSLEEENNTDPGATSSSSPVSSQQVEHVIHGSPLWLIAGIAVVLVMVVTPTDWGCWLPLMAFAMLGYGSFEYLKTVIVSWNQEQRHVEVFEGSRYSQERELMLSYTSQAGDLITIESKPTSGIRLDILGSRDYWLVVKRKDGTFAASSKDTENSRYFAKRIKDCLDLLG